MFKYKIKFLFGVTVFTPTLNHSMGSTGILIPYIVTAIFILIFYFLEGAKVRLYTQRESTNLYVIVACLVWYSIAILLPSVFMADNLIVRDAYDIYRPISYLLFIIAPFMLIRNHDDVRQIQIALVICTIVIGFLSINQLIRWNDAISLVYTKGWNVITGRLSVPFLNPYDLAYFMILILPMAVTGLYVNRNLWWMLLAAVSVLILLFTQSRSVMGAGIIQLVVIVPLVLFLTRRTLKSVVERTSIARFRLLLFAVLLTIGGVWFWTSYSTDLVYLVSGFERVIVGDEVGPMAVRKAQFYETIDRAAASLPVALLGNGPAKAEIEFVESNYVYFLFRYGLIGMVILFVIPFIVVVWNLIVSLQHVEHRHEYVLVVALLAWLLALPIASIGNNFTEQVRLSFVYYFTIGLSIRLVTLLRNRG